jgi:hypothetical protein
MPLPCSIRRPRVLERWSLLTVLALGLSAWTTAAAQTVLHAGAGAGYTGVVDEGRGSRSGNRNWFGMVGVETKGPVGFRLEGAETMSRLWMSADLTYRLGAHERPIRPYSFIGAGFVLDWSKTDPLLTLGAGLRIQASRLVFLFTEARLQWVPSMQATATAPELVLPLTAGLGIGY